MLETLSMVAIVAVLWMFVFVMGAVVWAFIVHEILDW